MLTKPFIRIAVTATVIVFSLIGHSLRAEPPEKLDHLTVALPDSLSLEGKVVYVDFWASWCPPCRQSFPWMKALEGKHSNDSLLIVAVNLDKEHAAAEKFLKETSVPFTIIFDSSGYLAEKYELQAIPTSFLYGHDGILRSTHQGFRAEDTLALDSLIVSLLKEGIDK